MGIFGKKKYEQKEKQLPHAIDLTTLDNLKNDDNFPDIEIKKINSHKQTTNISKSQLRFGIDDAISLIRSLPKKGADSTTVAKVMRQTLESVGVHFVDIIKDARDKESQIHEASNKIQHAIEDLKQKVESLKGDLVKLKTNLDETETIREFLLEAMDEVSDSKTRSSTTEVNHAHKNIATPKSTQLANKNTATISSSQNIYKSDTNKLEKMHTTLGKSTGTSRSATLYDLDKGK